MRSLHQINSMPYVEAIRQESWNVKKENPEKHESHWYDGTNNFIQQWSEKATKKEQEKFWVEGEKGF